jgi:uncharacterized protein
VPRLPIAWLRLKLWPFLIWAVVVTCVSLRAFAFEVPPLEGRVTDRAGLLSTTTKEQLTTRLAEHERVTGVQIAILTIDSLDATPIEDYSIRVVEAWKLGKKGQDNGVLILVAKNDRKMRIEVGYGLEGTLPDIVAGQIVRRVMAPRFRNGDYAGGIALAVEAVIKRTGGEDQSSSVTSDDSTSAKRAAPQYGTQTTKSKPQGVIGTIVSFVFGFIKFAFFLVIILLFVVFNILGGGRRRGGGFYVGGGSLGGGHSSGGFSGGGGGFSGGGGSFGGGGASGDW